MSEHRSTSDASQVGDSDELTNQVEEDESIKQDLSNAEEADKTESKVEDSNLKTEDSASNPLDKEDKKDAFLSPASLPPMSKSLKKDEPSKKRSPVSMAFHSKFAIPADIYKAPKVAAFMVDQPVKSKAKVEAKTPVTDEENKTKPECSKPKPPPAKLTYEEPDWSREPENDKYSFEILKMGSIVGNFSLSKKNHFVVGRLADCDIKMEHPSISRYHAVLQYGAPGPDCADVELQKDGSSGFYIYDLGSTHGTFVNKAPASSRTFYRLKVGHVIKFGGSTRLHILQGPSEDEEEEAKESATELREMNRQRIKKKKDLERMMLGEDSSSDEENEKTTSRKNNEDTGISWGMMEDAVQSSSDEDDKEEEGEPLSLHPDAITVQVKKDPFYVKDPVKALKNLYEREKMDLDFEYNEKRPGQWHVRLCLPVDSRDGKPVYAEATATGKKKDTMTQCSLEACRILERHGMFHHVDHHKQKAKQWEKDDFYDSEEDEFHDRTGELQLKRAQRMKRVGKSSKNPKSVETFESLSKKVRDLENELKEIETKLQKDKEVTKMNSDSVDPLDAFMQQVKSGKALDTTTRAKLKHRFFEAKKELVQAAKLADLARPSSLPPLTSSYTKTYSFIGKMKGKKKPVASFTRPIQEPEIMETGTEENIVEEEEEETENKESTEKVEDESVSKNTISESSMKSSKNSENSILVSTNDEEKTEQLELRIPQTDDNEVKNQDTKIESRTEIAKTENVTPKNPVMQEKPSRKRTLGPTLPPELREQLISEQDKPDHRDNQEEDGAEPKRRRKRIRKPKPAAKKDDMQFSNDPDYCGWLPPEDQSGDGKTSLNEKLGY